jgi:tyrosyl-tRNA synthetase
LPDDIPDILLDVPEAGLPLPQALKLAGLVPSTSEALRLLGQGGVRLGGERVEDRARVLVRGTDVVVQVGKRKFARLIT